MNWSTLPGSTLPYHPASCQEDNCYSHHLPRLVRSCHFTYGIAGFRLTHDEVCGQLKGPRSTGLQSVRSLIDTDEDTTPRLLSRASQPPGLSFIIFNPKSCTCQRYIFSDVEPITAVMDPYLRLYTLEFSKIKLDGGSITTVMGSTSEKMYLCHVPDFGLKIIKLRLGS
jgi:hypothetical protein